MLERLAALGVRADAATSIAMVLAHAYGLGRVPQQLHLTSAAVLAGASNRGGLGKGVRAAMDLQDGVTKEPM